MIATINQKINNRQFPTEISVLLTVLSLITANKPLNINLSKTLYLVSEKDAISGVLIYAVAMYSRECTGTLYLGLLTPFPLV